MSGRTLRDQLGKAPHPRDDANRRGAVELDNRDARRAQFVGVGLAAQQADDRDLVGERWTRGREPGEHALRAAADEKIGCDVEDLPRPMAHAHLSRQACSISTVHSGYCQLRVPSRCSCQARRTGSARTKSVGRKATGRQQLLRPSRAAARAARHRSARRSPFSADRSGAAARSGRARGAAAICPARPAP